MLPVIVMHVNLTRWLQLRLDFDSTAVRQPIDVRSHYGHSEVTLAADPLATVTLTYIRIYLGHSFGSP